jgi:hypothetical protein
MPQDLRSYVSEHSAQADAFEEARRAIREQRVISDPEPLLTSEQLITLIILLSIFIPLAWLLGAQYLSAFPTIPQP